MFFQQKKRVGGRPLNPMNSFGGEDADPFLSADPRNPNGSAVDVFEKSNGRMTRLRTSLAVDVLKTKGPPILDGP